MPTRHYFDASPEVPSRPSTVELRLPDATITLGTDRGVFSGARVDPGTVALLREEGRVAAQGDLLDLGCGYGPIACTLARRSPRARVWAVDVNERAMALTRENARSLGLGNVVAVAPEEVPDGVAFAEIWSNPPIRIGKEALHALLNRWLARLEPAGRAVIVVHRNLGGDSLAEWLAGGGWLVHRRGSKQGYRVLELRRSASHGSGAEAGGGATAGGGGGAP